MFYAPGWTTATLSAYLHRKVVLALWSYFQPSSGLTPRNWDLSYAEDPKTGSSTPQVRIRGAESPPSTGRPLSFDLIWLAFWTSSSHRQVVSRSSSSYIPKSSQDCSQFLLCPACIFAWDCPDSHVIPCICPCWTSWGS